VRLVTPPPSTSEIGGAFSSRPTFFHAPEPEIGKRAGILKPHEAMAMIRPGGGAVELDPPVRGMDKKSMEKYDLIIVGAGPGGLASAITAQELGLSYLVLEKGKKVLQGIIDSYPRGKKVYPTIPKGEEDPFPVEDLAPSLDHNPVEEYLAQIEACVERRKIAVGLSEEFQGMLRDKNEFTVSTNRDRYRAAHVVLAFGSNIPGDLGIYGEAKTVARNLDNPEEHIGAPTLVLGGGNAAADTVSTLSKVKRAAGDLTTVYWAHRKVQFKVDKDVARDLGEEILLGGSIRILPGAIPQIGEVDEDGVERLIIQTQKVHVDGGVELHEGMSFPMKHVIACVGTQGPAPVFASLGLQQIVCTEGMCKISKEGAQLLMLTPELQASVRGVYAIGGAISPAYILISEKGVLREQKHTNLIYTAVKDGVRVAESIARQKSQT
jgi:thioredoxin reductase